MLTIILFVLGFLLGSAVSALVIIITRFNPVGILHCDRTDPDGPYLFLELKESLNDIDKMKYVTLTVDHEDNGTISRI